MSKKIEFNNHSKEWIIEDLIEKGSTMLIKAESGAGLTWFLSALSIGIAHRSVLAGDRKKTEGRELVFSHFCTSNSVDVTYCEGSLTSNKVIERIINLKNKELNMDCKINLFCRNGKDLDFNYEETRSKLDSKLNGNNDQLVIFDSLSTLFGDDKSNGVTSSSIHNWLKGLRNKNVTMIFVAPIGLEKECIKIPDSFFDIEIKVSKVPSLTRTEMRIEFLKTNYLDKKASIPFRLSLESSENGDGKVNLVYKDDPNFYIWRVLSLSKEGIPQTKIARELGLNQSTISRWLSKGLTEKAKAR